MAMAAIKLPKDPAGEHAVMTETPVVPQPVPQPAQQQSQPAPKRDPYDHILYLIEQLAPDERLALIQHLVQSLQPIVSAYTAEMDYNDDSEDELLAKEAEEAMEYARAHPETVMSLEEFEAELDRAEAAGELPD